jgi:signal transduction histidine kinase
MAVAREGVPISRGTRGGTSFAAIQVLKWVMVALFLVFLIGLVVLNGDVNPTINVGVSIASQWVPAAIFWLVVYRTGLARWDVLFAAIGVSFSALGDTYYSIAMDEAGYLEFPSIADIGYLLFYPFMIAAVVALIRHQRGRFSRAVMLDSAVASLGAAAVLAVVLSPVLGEALTSETGFSSVVAVLYPVLDVMIVAAVVGIAASPSLVVGLRWGWLVAGLLTLAAGDVAYALLEYYASYSAGTPLDAVWTLGLVFLSIWVLAQQRDFPVSTRSKSFAFPVPAVAVIAGLAVLVLATQFEVSYLAIVLAASTVALAALPMMLRQAVLARLLEGQQTVVRQLEELDRGKSEMMSTVNHELRTPLTSIRGYVELLMEGEGGAITDEGLKMLRVVDHNADRLENLVNDMLTMSGLDAQNVALSSRPVDLVALLGTVEHSLRPFAKSRDVEILIEADNVTAVVSGDRKQLERAFTNLTHNAIKFTPEGGSVGIELELEGSAVVTRIIDTGIGIPERDVPLLFGRFFRASNAQAEAVPGTGLGLAIVRGIVVAHGGAISVASTEGIGTTVRVELPAATTAP